MKDENRRGKYEVVGLSQSRKEVVPDLLIRSIQSTPALGAGFSEKQK